MVVFFQILKKMSKIKLTLNKINVIVVTNIKVTQNKLIGGSMVKTLEEALERITKLEEENKKLLSELEYYRNRNYGGRKKHNEAWMAAYNDFAGKYESGMTINEIVAEGDISRRTAYRYKAYYDELKSVKENK